MSHGAVTGPGLARGPTLCHSLRSMKLGLASAGSLLLLGVTNACSSSSKLGPGASVDGGVLAEAGLGDGSAADPDAAAAYNPKGCPYTVTELASRGYTGIAPDDTTQPSSAAAAAPLRVRVGLRGNTTKGEAGYADPTTTAAFTWETAGATTNARIRYGTSPAALASGAAVQTGFVYTVPSSGIGGYEPPDYFHEVDVCGLTPGTTYYYQVGGGAPGQEIWSPTQSFATAPTTGPITVGVFGDARTTVSTWQMVNQRMAGSGASLLLVSGDVVDSGVDATAWQQWLDAIWTDPSDASGTGFLTLGQFIMVPINGNHENESSQFYANFAIPGTGAYANTYASFDVGNTHFVLIDDQEIGLHPTGAAAAAQLAWIDSDLKAANADRAKHPFIVTMSHRCLFSTATSPFSHHADADVLQARASLAPLFDKYHVDLVLNGHDHEYERSLPLTAGNPPSGAPVVQTALAQGTTYVVNAGAGADPYQPDTAPAASRSGDATGFGTFSAKGYLGCYVLLTLNGTTVTYKAYGMKASGSSVADDDVIDTIVFGQ